VGAASEAEQADHRVPDAVPGPLPGLVRLGAKAVEAARDSGLPARVLAAIDKAPRYAEGTGVRLEIPATATVQDVVRLAAIKVAH
jgi:hypothetical protein